MKHQTFYDLLQHCAADLKEKSTNFCRAVSPEERLVVTLRYCFEKQRKCCICGSVVCVCNTVCIHGYVFACMYDMCIYVNVC